MFCVSDFFLVSQEPKSFTTHPMALGMPNRCATFINCPEIIQKKFGIMYFLSKQSSVGNVFKPKMVNQFYWCLLVCRLYCQINCIIRMHADAAAGSICQKRIVVCSQYFIPFVLYASFSIVISYIYTTANYKTKASVAAAVFFNSLKNGPYCPLIIFSQWS